MSMTQHQATILSEALKIEYTWDECPAEMRFHIFAEQEFKKHLESLEAEVARARSIKPMTKKRSLFATAIQGRRDKYYQSGHNFIAGLKFDYEQKFKSLMAAGYRPGQTGTFENQKVRVNSVPTMRPDNTWEIPVTCASNKFFRVAVDELVLDGLEEAIIGGFGFPSLRLLILNECQIVDGDIENLLGYRKLRLRKLPGATRPHSWRVHEWVKTGWTYERVVETTH
jgi:hypothetical protein